MYEVIKQRALYKYGYYALCGALVSVLCVLFFKKLDLTIPRHIVCTIQGPLSKEGYILIEHFISEKQKEHYSPLLLLEGIKNNFSWVKDVNISVVSQLYHVNITMHNPIAVINSTYLLLNSGSIFERSLYKESYYNTIPSIIVNNDEIKNQKTMADLGRFIQAIPTEIFNFYTFTFHNSHSIILKDRSCEQFRVITSLDNNIVIQQLIDCLRIKQILHQNGSFKKKTDYRVADLRFSNHIIVAKKGNNYGSQLS